MSKDCTCARINKLKELTESLPSFPLSVKGQDGDKWKKGKPDIDGNSIYPILDSDSNGYKEYQMEEGECFAWFIHRSGNSVAVHRWFSSKGTKFPQHVHPEKEFIVIYQGIIELTKNGETKIYNLGDYIYNEPLVPHSAFFPEDCKFITITIPPAKEFPNGTR